MVKRTQTERREEAIKRAERRLRDPKLTCKVNGKPINKESADERTSYRAQFEAKW